MLPSFYHFSRKNAFDIKSTRELKLFLENCLLRYGELKTAFRRNFSLKCGFCSKSIHGILFLENCVLLYCGLKTAFFEIFTISRRKCVFYQIHSWIKTLSLNYFCLHCGLKRAICQVFTISSKKLRFALNPLLEYKSFSKTVSCSIVG